MSSFRSLLRVAVDRLRLGPETPVVVGCSAGVDSTVLARSLHALGVPVVLVHVHYGLRGAEADADADQVMALAAELGRPGIVRRVRVGAGNLQEAARDARYQILAEVARENGADAVAVGHTASDQAETLLMHLARGTGLHGLRGMPDERLLEPGVRLVRPLLSVTRAAVEAEAREQGWTWREDTSNATDAFRRNQVRRSVLPGLEAEWGPDVAMRMAAVAREVAATVAASDPGARLKRAGTPTREGGHLPLIALRVLTEPERRAVVSAMLRAWAPRAPRSRANVERIVDLLDAQVGRRVDLGRVTVWRDRHALTVQAVSPPWAGRPVEVGARVRTPFGVLALMPGADDHEPRTRDPHRVAVDHQALEGPLSVRPWQQGDRLRLATGSRLVSDLLTDAKVEPSERAQQLVLTAGERIVWLVGRRVDAGHQATRETDQRVCLEWLPTVEGRGEGE